jgi:type VI secretion system protein ImpB
MDPQLAIFVMNDSSSNSDAESSEVGMHVSSDPDRTEIEQPDPSGTREEASLPFRILLVSDLTPEASPEDWSAGDHVHRVDANRFTDFMAEMAPQLSLEVRNTLSDTPQTWDLDLTFSELEAFEPEPLARQVEPTAQLLDVRDLVEKVGDGSLDLDTFRTRLDELGIEMEWADELYQTLAGEDEPLDRLIGMVDVEEEDELEICKRSEHTDRDPPIHLALQWRVR